MRLWQGSHKRIERLWLRFYDAAGNLIPTEAEETERERQEKQQVQTALQELRDRLQAMGLDPDNLPNNS